MYVQAEGFYLILKVYSCFNNDVREKQEVRSWQFTAITKENLLFGIISYMIYRFCYFIVV